MSEYQISSTTAPVHIVFAGSPETLIINHSTKYTVYIGDNNMIGSGNLSDATPLDPYASIVVNGQADVWCVAAAANQPCQVLTQSNALNWSPKSIQPNIVDPASPMVCPTGTTVQNFVVPPGAQGMAIYVKNLAGSVPNWTNLTVEGIQTQNFYINRNPATDNNYYYYVPVLSDDDSGVSVAITSTAAGPLSFNITWIMSTLVSAVVPSGGSQDVTVVNSALPVTQSGVWNVNASEAGTWNVNATEVNKQMFANQEPVPFDVTVAAGATSVLLTASGGVQYFLHNVRMEFIGTSATNYAQLQDTGGTTIANLLSTQVGTAANQFQPPFGDTQFHGAPLPLGLGLQVKNNGSSSLRMIGTVSYSK